MRINLQTLMRLSIGSLMFVGVTIAGCSAPATPSATVAPAKSSAPANSGAPSSQPTSVVSAPAKPSAYKLAHVVPLTGPSAEFGSAYNQTMLYAVESINAKGGIDGVKVDLVTEDSMGDPKQGVTAFNKVVQVDKVPAVMEAWSSVVMATAPLAEQAQVALFNYGANATTIRGIGKFTFSTFPLADLDIKVLAEYMYDQKSMRKGAVIYINNDTGRTNAEVFKQAFEAKGGKIVAFETHQPEALDFGAQLAKIKAGEPDVVHIPTLAELPRIAKQAREMGIKAQFTSYSAAEGQAVLDLGGDAVQGMIYTYLAPPETNPVVKEWMDAYKAKYGKAPQTGSAYHMYIWDTMTTIYPEAVKYAQQKGYGYSGEALRKALSEIKTFATPLTGKTIFQFPGQDVTKNVTLKVVNAKNKSFDTLTVIEAK